MTEQNLDGENVTQSTSNVNQLESRARVTLADVRYSWAGYQSKRARDAVYWYLDLVCMLADWWTRKPEEMHQALEAERALNPSIKFPSDIYATVIMLTADANKADAKTRSKWSRVLRYAAEYNSPSVSLEKFVTNLGGINKCAARYAQHLGRHTERNRKPKKKR